MKSKDNLTPWNVLDSYRGKEFSGEWPTLDELFHITCLRFPDRPCWEVFSPEHSLFPYSEAEKKIKRIASFFIAKGLKKGDKVIVSGKNSPEWAFVYIATIYAGATIVPMDNMMDEPTFEKLAAFSDAVMLFADKQRLDNTDTSKFLFVASLEKTEMYPYILALEQEETV